MKKGRKRYWKILILLALLVFLFLFLFFGFRIQTVTVSGCSYYTEEEIRNMIFTSPWEYNSLVLYVKNKFIGTKEYPFIQKMTISRKGRHEVKIQVYEKALTGCVKYMNQFIYFDKDGIVLECAEKAIDNIPYITGIEYQGFTLYEKLKVSDEAVFNRILSLSQLLQRHEFPLDRIHFSEDGAVMLQTEKIKIYLGKREFYDEPVAALAEILPTILKKDLKGKIYMENYTTGDDIIFHKD